MNWEVQDGVPIPPGGTGRRATWRGLAKAVQGLNVGQCLFITGMDRSSVTGTCSTVARNWGYRFVTRSVDDGMRVWRVA